jgi:hypothetical protein
MGESRKLTFILDLIMGWYFYDAGRLISRVLKSIQVTKKRDGLIPIERSKCQNAYGKPC